jgi:hypothetical protein
MQPRDISILEPIGAAFEKTKQILFQPFDIAKWFTIGFCAWLATLGEGRNYNFNFYKRDFDKRDFFQPQDFQRGIENFKDSLMENVFFIIPLLFILFLIFLFVVLVLLWLRSRGQFMFLDCVARNVAEIKTPWRRYAAEGDSLYRFKLVLCLGGLVANLVFIVPMVLLLLPMFRTDFAMFAFAQMMPVLFLGLGLVVIGMAFAAVTVLTKDFVVPIMYVHHCGVMDAWRAFWRLCSANLAKFTLFLLFLLVVGMAVGMVVILAVLMTCCCAACIFAIPYLGTVAMLPILVWRRAYSALFLAQFGPEFDVFAQPETGVVPTDAFPITPETPEAPPERPQD